MKVFFAIPSYRGVRCVPFFESLEATIRLFEEAGHKTVLSILSGCCYIQMSRLQLVKQFLDSDCDRIFFLDDDISWNAEDALRMIDYDDDVLAGIYPHKKEIEDYPVVINVDEKNRPLTRRDLLISGAFLPTGFMVVKRRVFELIKTAYPELSFYDIDKNGEKVHYFDYFPQGVKQGRWVGEDFAFCRLWSDIGGKMWIVPDIDFVHYDLSKNAEHRGNYHRFLLSQPMAV